MNHLSHKTIGLIFALLGFSIFSFCDVAIKITATTYDPFAVALYMNIFTILFLIPLTIYLGPRKVVSTKSFRFHALRSYFLLINFVCVIYAFSQLPLATAYVIIFSMPFILNLQAMTVLKEKISPHRWLAILLGLVGIVIAMRPGMAPISLAMIAALGGTFFNSASAITVKFIDKKDHWLSYTVYLMMFQTPVLALIVLLRGGDLIPNLTDTATMPWFIAAGMAYIIALSAIPQALQRIDSSIVGAMIYIAFPWGLFYGYFIFNDHIDLWTALGAVIIIASGIFLIYREKIENSKILEIEKNGHISTRIS